MGELGCLFVVGSDIGGAGVTAEGGEAEQRRGHRRAVKVAVAGDGPLVSALGAAVGRVQVLDQFRPGPAQTQGPILRHPVGITGVSEHVAQRHARSRHGLQHGHERRDGVFMAARKGCPAH
jgi:hypothetical protein